MARSLIAFCLGTALGAVGCVPVTEPVGAVDKAEPDKALVGKWAVTGGSGLADATKPTSLTFDVPAVKGNPKGLMREAGAGGDAIWFFTTKIGKHTYASIVLEPDGTRSPKFDKEGAFEKWKADADKRYFIFKYALDGDRLKIDCGSTDKFPALMRDEKFDDTDGKHVRFFKAPAGWLAKRLDKTDPAKIFDGSNALELKREKK